MPADFIKPVDHATVSETGFARRFADSVVLTKDGQLLLQQRPLQWSRGGGHLTTFGGAVEAGETPLQALVRELKEELGANVLPRDVIALGAITEAFTSHTELVYTYLWWDRRGTITGCYEGEAVSFGHVKEAIEHPKLMDYVRWMPEPALVKAHEWARLNKLH